MGRAAWVLLLLIATGLVAWLAVGAGDLDRSGGRTAVDGPSATRVSESEALAGTDLDRDGPGTEGADLAANTGARREARPPASPEEAPASASVSGRLEVGVPLHEELGVRVVATSFAGTPRRVIAMESVPVASDGAFSVEVPSEAHVVALHPEAPMLRRGEDVEVPPGARNVVLHSELLASVRGVVRRPRARLDDTRLAYDHRIQVTCSAGGGGFFTLTSGFEIRELPVGVPLTIEVTNEIRDLETGQRSPGMSATAELLPLAPLEQREVVLTLVPLECIEGVVLDARGLPVVNARVRAVRVGPSGERVAGSTRHTGGDGRFRLDPLDDGDWTLEVRAGGNDRASVHLRLPEARDEEFEIVLGIAPVVSGVVVGPDGSPVAGAKVGAIDEDLAAERERRSGPSGSYWMEQADEERTVADANGEFVLSLHSGVVRLVAFEGGMSTSPPVTLELLPGQRTSGVELRLAP